MLVGLAIFIDPPYPCTPLPSHISHQQSQGRQRRKKRELFATLYKRVNGLFPYEKQCLSRRPYIK